MGLRDVLEKIMKKEHLGKDLAQLKQRIVEKDEEYLPLFITAIQKSSIKSKKIKKKRMLRELDDSPFYGSLANCYTDNKKHRSAIALFEAMRNKGCNEPAILHDYGAAILMHCIFEKQVTKERIDEAKDLIFLAHSFDTTRKGKVKDYTRKAYRNLCLIRNMEAKYYYNKKENLTSFVLGWMSIEMTLNRLWYQYVTKKIR